MLALPPPLKPIIHIQVPALPALTSTSINIDSKSKEEERIRQLEVTIRNLTNKLTL